MRPSESGLATGSVEHARLGGSHDEMTVPDNRRAQPRLRPALAGRQRTTMSRIVKSGSSLAAVLWAASCVASDARVVDCSGLTAGGPGLGAVYSGVVHGGPYEVSVTVPPGMTGWGAGEGAAFHGFSIFLPEDRAACLDFEIHLRVEEAERPRYPSRARRVSIGGIAGWEWRSEGAVRGVSWTNIRLVFSVHHHGDHFDDGALTLVVPTAKLSGAEPIFRRFVSQVRIDGGPG